MKKTIKRIIYILSILIVIVLAAAPHFIMGDLLNSRKNVKTEKFKDLKAKKLSLITEDNLKIAAWEVKAKNPKAIVIILSGIEKPSVTAFQGYSKFLKKNKYSSLLIEMRGHGLSEGERVALGMEEYLDVKSGVEYIRKNDKDIPIIVWGTSMGASCAITSIGRLTEIDGVISCSAYSSWTDVFSDYLEENGVPKIIVKAERPFIDLYLGMKYGFNKLKIKPVNEIKKLKGRPLLLAHSTKDSQIPFKSFKRLSENSEGENIEVFIREGNEHFICYDEYFNNPGNDKEFSEAILSFLSNNF